MRHSKFPTPKQNNLKIGTRKMMENGKLLWWTILHAQLGDDAPFQIPDPQAEQPEDWDEEDD